MMKKKVLINVFIFGITFILLKFKNYVLHGISDTSCILEAPETLSQFWKKPLDCLVCANTSSIDEFATISADNFEQKYAYTGRPVVVRGAAKHWTAMNVFNYDFFRRLNNITFMAECQFLTYNDEFHDLNEALNMEDDRTKGDSQKQPWYFGWGVCDPTAVHILRSYYEKPYFLSPTSENYIVDWIFMGVTGYGARLHIDNVHLPSWQAQITGKKRWTIQTPTECLYACLETYTVDMYPGDIIVLDTNLWYHATEVISKEISVTVGAEYD